LNKNNIVLHASKKSLEERIASLKEDWTESSSLRAQLDESRVVIST
jgi:hypothetical protein